MDSLVITGTRISVRAGGAQDINHFRSIAFEEEQMPRPESLTLEGLLSEHDLPLKLTRPCEQLFCLATEAMPISFALRPDDRYLIGLGFTSNIEAKSWRREPLNLIAVVDKSGSMDGEPLDLVRQALSQITRQLVEGDQLSIVLYGDVSELYLSEQRMPAQRKDALKAIAAIESSGSTDMESGLAVGFAHAAKTAPDFAGNTRVMLFTDEQPNVGATDASSFMGMAEHASKGGVGMTTVGVGVQFDGALASKIGSVRGGNLFFVADPKQVTELFAKQLDTMVSELAHDLDINMTPPVGYRISAVFGVPDAMMESAAEGTIRIRIPTVFVSSTAGGIFVSLAKDSVHADLPAPSLNERQALLDLSLSYVAAGSHAPGTDRLAVPPLPSSSKDRASKSMRKAAVLIDQFLSMRAASVAFHREGKPKQAFAYLDALHLRIKQVRLGGLKGELRLIGQMRAIAARMSGYSGESDPQLSSDSLLGLWQVSKIKGSPFVALKVSDVLEISEELLELHQDDYQYFELQRQRMQLRLTQPPVTLHARWVDEQLLLHTDQCEIWLTPSIWD